MPPKKAKQAKRWSMYPSFHDKVSDILHEHNLFFDFYEEDDSDGCIKDWDTKIKGRFTCRSPRCASRRWASKQVAITIRMYPGEKYNARVYHQRCEVCDAPSKPILDSSYAERVAYRIKKWCGIEMDVPPYSGQSKGPHKSGLCEGCQAGHCSGLRL